jgi:hypothetical protein
MPRTRKQVNQQIKKRTGVDPVSQREPWRYNKALGEDERWDIFNTLHMISMGVNDVLELETYFPNKKELPEEGGWVWILRPPCSTVEATFGALYFAKPWVDAEITYGWHKMKYSVTCFTQNGEIRLWPYEYAYPDITEMIEFWADGAFEFHPFDEAVAGQELTDRLFYITSRGIPMVEALPMVLGDLNAPIGWFEMKEGS